VVAARTTVRAALEDSITRDVAFYRKQVDERQWYGFWHYGDVMHTYDSDRHTWRYDVGGFAWDNAELGTDAALWYAFLRSGDAATFRLARAMTQHVSEVDVHHSGPFAGLGSRHNVMHWGDGAKEARVSESFTKRFSYYLTADDLLGDLIRTSLRVDETLVSIDPLREVLPPQSIAPARPGAAVLISEDGVRSPFHDTLVTGCRFYLHGSATGFSSINQRSIVLANNQFLGSKAGTGIAVNDSDNTTIVQNVFYNLQYGIHGIRGAVRVYNAGCVVLGNSMSGFQKALFFENWETVQAIGNMLDGASLNCVHLVDCYNSMLSENYLGPTGTDAALLIETSQPRGNLGQIVFSNNYINHYGGNSGEASIEVFGGSSQHPVDQVTLTGNILNSYPSIGIHLRNAQNVLINGNTLSRASSTADGVRSVYDETPGANHIANNIVDAAIDAPGDTVNHNYQRVPLPS
jgi:hypothetical protein